MNLNLGQWVVIGICALLLIAYIRGYFYNRQQARRISNWLQEGMRGWGRVVSAEGKLPGMASGGRLEVTQADPPLRNMEAVFILAPRENPLFYIFYTMQGKRDELVVWMTFHSAPKQSVEVARPGDKQLESRLKEADKPALKLVEAPAGLKMASEEKEEALVEGKVRSFVQSHPGTILRLALRPSKPHLFLRANLRAVQSNPAEAFFKELSELR